MADLTLDSNTIGRSPEPHNEKAMEYGPGLTIQLALHWKPLYMTAITQTPFSFLCHTRMHLAKRRLIVFLFSSFPSAMLIIDGAVFSRLSWKALYGSYVGSEKNIASGLISFVYDLGCRGMRPIHRLA